MPMLSLQDSPAAEYNRALACAGPHRIEHLLRAASAGCHRAQFLLALSYHMGQDAPADYVRAASWYEQAASRADSFAMANLGMMCLSGEPGPADEVEAYTWIRSAAGLGRHELDSLLQQLECRIAGSDTSPCAFPIALEAPEMHPCTATQCDPSRCGDL